MTKYSEINDNIRSGNSTDTFCQNTEKFQKSVCVCGGGGEGGATPLPHTPPAWHALINSQSFLHTNIENLESQVF